jgi:hypothetical protein
MTTAGAFEIFLNNIKVDDYDQIGRRYHEITKKLNQKFRNTDSDIANCLQVGSYGRYTGIKGISDLDMLYIMPNNQWNGYKNNPSQLLRDVKDAIQLRYPTTEVKVDRLVVDVFFSNFTFEVQPVFEIIDDDEIYYKYPDTYNGGSYRITKPRHEQQAMTEFRQEYGEAHRHLCKMVRSWKNNVGQCMGGLLVDTLTYKFLSSNLEKASCSYSTYDSLCRDFFGYLKDEPDKTHYQALGSGQDVKVKKRFQRKAKKAYVIAVEASEESDDRKRNDKWREIFGRAFPKEEPVVESKAFDSTEYRDPEQFIEDFYPVDIRYSVSIDCEIQRNGFREIMLSALLAQRKPISRVRSLLFQVTHTDVPEPYVVKWKVRNVGEVAKQKKCLRGEIYDSNKNGNMRKESSDFFGPHYVECYVIKHGVVVARERIDVPIE